MDLAARATFYGDGDGHLDIFLQDFNNSELTLPSAMAVRYGPEAAKLHTATAMFHRWDKTIMQE